MVTSRIKGAAECIFTHIYLSARVCVGWNTYTHTQYVLLQLSTSPSDSIV